ncbi:MAG: ATP-binding protein [Acidobacteriota bacterium]
MLSSRILWKLYAGYAIVILISTVIVGGLISRRIEAETLDEIQRSLSARAFLLRDAAARSFLSAGDASLQARIRTIGRQIGTRLTVIRSDGLVLADSDKNPDRMDNHANRPEIMQARSHGRGTATRLSHTLGTRMMYLALPVRADSSIIGYVRTSLPLSVIDRKLAHGRAIVLVGAASSAVIALLVGFFLARGFTRPLTTMTRVAQMMARGEYDHRLPTTTRDEIGELASALNQMAESCSLRMQRITSDHDKLLAILAAMVEGVIAVDRDERVVHLNRAAIRILGPTQGKGVGDHIWELIRLPEIADAITTSLREAGETRRELRIPTSGGDRVIEMHASPLRDGGGEPTGAVIVLHDVSELKRLGTTRRDFVANVSHELKTPIAAIRGLVETVIDDASMSPQQRRRFLGKIQSQSLRLSTIVTDLLTLSRLETAGDGLVRSLLDLRAIVDRSVKDLLPSGEAKGITIASETPDEPVTVLGDKEALCQTVNNLLDNAVKYTPAGGSVRVRLRVDGTNAFIEVQDTGIGIEPRHQHRIFERFYRADKARSRELGGTGLGLSIVRHIALAHGGLVSMESTPGEGSTFRVSLPLAPPSA